ncbi:hypothetical protein V8C44DRAFT_342737, partial [Trichoderma aethiopicum]
MGACGLYYRMASIDKAAAPRGEKEGKLSYSQHYGAVCDSSRHLRWSSSGSVIPVDCFTCKL